MTTPKDGKAHTPGPWEILLKEHGARSYIVNEKRAAIAELKGYGSADILAAAPLADERVANAHLLAAAPDLLDAAKLALDCLGKVAGWNKHLRERYDKIKTAIAKAEGRDDATAI